MTTGPDVGGAWIELHADGKDLPREMKASAEKAAKQARARVQMDPEVAADFKRKLTQKIKEQGEVPIPVEADLDRSFRTRLEREVTQLASQIEAEIPLTADGEKFRTEVSAQVRALTEGLRVQIPVDPEAAAEARQRLRAQIETLQLLAAKEPIEVPIEVEPDAVDNVEELIRRLGGGGGGGGGLSGAVRRLVRSAAAVPAAVGTIATLGPALGGLTAAVTALVSSLAQAAGAAIPAVVAVSSLGLAGVTAKVGMQGFGDAVETVAGSLRELRETGKISGDTLDAVKDTLADMPKPMQEAVRAVAALTVEFDKVRTSVQKELFVGVGREIGLLSRTYLPILRTQLTQTAITLSLFATDFVEFLRSTGTSNRITQILSGLQPILATLLSAVRPLTGAFLILFQESLPSAQKIADAIADTANAVLQLATSAQQSGSFKQFLDDAVETAGILIRTIGNIGSIIGSIFGAGDQLGGGLLSTFEQLTAQAAAFFNSAEGQQALATFFGLITRSAQLASAAFSVLGPLVSGLGAVFNALQGPVAALQAALLPIIQTISGQLGGALRSLAPQFAALVVAVTPLITVLGQGLGVVLGALITAITPLIPIIVQMAQVFVGQLVPVIQQVAPILAALVLQLGQLALVLAPSSAEFLKLALALAPLIPPILTLVVKLVELGTILAGVIIPVVIGATQSFTRLVAIMVSIVAAIAGFVSSLVSGISQAVAAVRTGVGFIRDNLANLPGWFRQFFGDAIAAAVRVLTGFISTVGGLAARIVSAIVNPLKGLGAKLFDIGSLAAAAGRAVSAIVGAFDGLAGKILGKVQGLAGKIAAAITPNIDIPGFAKGTIANGPTLGIFGEAGQELVVPTSPNAQLAPGVEAMLRQVAAARFGSDGGGSGSGVTVVQNITLPTGDPQAAALATVNALVAAL